MAKKKQENKPKGVRVTNRKARHDYEILEKVECGIELVGTEVKSVRNGQIKIDEAYARLRNGELWLIGANISLYQQAGEKMQHDPTRDRKLLIHRRQIRQLETHVKQKGKTLVPLSVFFKRGWCKVDIGVAVGKRQYDKRETLKRRQQEREMKRQMKRYNR
ncbi:MAG: SsrA-binding protein SmpB [Phycisphaerae bacterium]